MPYDGQHRRGGGWEVGLPSLFTVPMSIVPAFKWVYYNLCQPAQQYIHKFVQLERPVHEH